MSTTRMMVLGLVRWLQPVHGYDVRRELASWNVEEWAELKPGSVYHALKKLTAEGLLAEVATEQVGGRPARTTYRITPEGDAHFLELLRRYWWQNPRVVDPFHSALAFLPALRRGEAVLAFRNRARVLRAQADRLRDNLTALNVPGEPTPTHEPVPTHEPAPTREPAPTHEPVPTHEPAPAHDPALAHERASASADDGTQARESGPAGAADQVVEDGSALGGAGDQAAGDGPACAGARRPMNGVAVNAWATAFSGSRGSKPAYVGWMFELGAEHAEVEAAWCERTASRIEAGEGSHSGEGEAEMVEGWRRSIAHQLGIE